MLHGCPTAALTVKLRARRAGLLKKDDAMKNSYWLVGTRQGRIWRLNGGVQASLRPPSTLRIPVGSVRTSAQRVGTQTMQQVEPGSPLGPLELIKHLPEEVFASSDWRLRVGLEAVRYRNQPPNENLVPP
jgi:hypothetical protein